MALRAKVEIVRQSGGESFVSEGKVVSSVRNFWSWAYSDFLTNTARSILAEYIVSLAMGIDKDTSREEWTAYDLCCEGIKIEVKASAYLQSWEQNDYTKPVFSIALARPWTAENGYNVEACRSADVYVFCLLKHKDQDTVNPLDLDQWEFYVLPTKTLNTERAQQATISLPSLLNLNPQIVSFTSLRETVFKAALRNRDEIASTGTSVMSSMVS